MSAVSPAAPAASQQAAVEAALVLLDDRRKTLHGRAGPAPGCSGLRLVQLRVFGQQAPAPRV